LKYVLTVSLTPYEELGSCLASTGSTGTVESATITTQASLSIIGDERCFPTPLALRTFKKMSDQESKSNYEYRYYKDSTTLRDRYLTLEKCKGLCAADAFCQAISWTVLTTTTTQLGYSDCALSLQPFNAAHLKNFSAAVATSAEQWAVTN
jgi:hypothetical protein